MKITWRRQLAMAVLAGGMMWACGCSCVSEPAKIKADSSAFLKKYQEWQKLPKDDTKAKALLQELTEKLWFIHVTPVNGFNPHNTAEMQAELDKCGREWWQLRTRLVGDTLRGSVLTENPQALEAGLSKSKTLQLIKKAKVMPEMLPRFMAKISQSNPMTPEQLALMPTVADTFPRKGETVEADKVRELRVTFSRSMDTSGGWAFCSDSDEPFPGSSGKPHWADDRTCVMPVRLVPGRSYAVTFNAGRFNSFASPDGMPAKEYKLTFKTAGKSGETPLAEKPRVVDTVPRYGESLDAKNVKELRVTFSEDMNTDSYWSIVDGYGDFPQIDLVKINWRDPRTCVIPVKLESGKRYAVWFNHGPYLNFVNKTGNSSVPYMLVFSTK